MGVRLTHRALRDLGEIDDYSTQRCGRRTASRYLVDVHDALERLGERPGLLRHGPGLSPHLGFFRVREHLLVCDVLDGDLVVLAVLHGCMDLPRRVAELEQRLPDELRWLRGQAQRRPRPKKG